MIVRLLREQQLAEPLDPIPAGTTGEVYAFPESPAPLVRWHGRYPIVNVKWEDLEPLYHAPLRLAFQQLRPDPVAIVGGFRQSLAWTFKILIPAATAAAVAGAVQVWVQHLLGK